MPIVWLVQSFGWFFQPDVIFLLLLLAKLALLIELAMPGPAIGATIGTLALGLAILGMLVVTPNWIGLILFLLSFILVVLEIRITTYGVLSVLAGALQIVGGLFLFQGEASVSHWLLFISGGIMALIGFMLGSAALKAHKLPVKTGREGMIGERAVALTDLDPEGRVRYGGENWAAVVESAVSVQSGEEVRILALDGLRLRVQPMQQQRQHP